MSTKYPTHVSTTLLISRLYCIARQGLVEANRGKPFHSRAVAMSDLNRVRQLARQHNYY